MGLVGTKRAKTTAQRVTRTSALLRLLHERYGRVLVAIDDDGRFHVRRTMHVTHDAIRGEAVYAAKPLASGDTLIGALRAAARVHHSRTQHGVSGDRGAEGR